MVDETQLIESMKQGNKDAFDQIYDNYCNQILRMAYLIVGNRADSEDITQETFITCYLHCKELRNNAGFKSWLYQILTRTAWNYGKKSKREYPDEDIEQTAERTDGVTALDIIVSKELSNELYHAIKQLNLKHRTILIYYYYNQMSTKEIADICNCLEGTVKSRLFTARKQLKKILQRAELEGVYHEKNGFRYANQSNIT